MGYFITALLGIYC